MTKTKFDSLTKYAVQLTDKLADKSTPAKHTGHPESYRHFLKNELRLVALQLATAKEAGLTK